MGKHVFQALLEYIGINKDPIVGIDIGSSAVKLLHMAVKGNNYEILNYATQPLPPGVVVEKNVTEGGELISAIQDLVRKSGISTKYVCTSLPSSAVISKVIQFSSELTEKEIGDEIDIEAERYIPYTIDEVNLDYSVMGVSKKHRNLLDVMLVATKKENIEERIQIMEEAGLVAKIIDVDSFCCERAFNLVIKQLPEQGIDKLIALIDIGAMATSIYVFKNKEMLYSREQPFGGLQLMNEIQTRYGLSYEEAVLAEQNEDLPSEYYSDVLEPFKETIVNQIGRAIQLYHSTSGQQDSLDYLFLTGGTGSVTGLDEIIQESLDIKTYPANPFIDMEFAPSVDRNAVAKDSALLMNCCGLALRNIFR